MKNRSLFLIAGAAAIFLGLSLLTSCVGSRVDPVALFEPASLAWPAVREDVARGVNDAVADGDLSAISADDLFLRAGRLSEALESKSATGVRLVGWERNLAPWASRGIEGKLESMEVGPGVATSLREQLTRFTETIRAIEATR